MDDFKEIPILDLDLIYSESTYNQFLTGLQDALMRVGSFYLKGHDISDPVWDAALAQSRAFFELPLEQKLEIETVKSRHFLGYNRAEVETTSGYGESIAIAPDLPPPSNTDPVYYNLQGPSQWPDKDAIPEFRQAMEAYFNSLQTLGGTMNLLIEIALKLPEGSLTRLYNDSPFCQLKAIRYPPPPAKEALGDGMPGARAHKDSVFLTYLLQGSEHKGLEAQNKAGAWVPIPPIEGTLVVHVGRILETLTGGICTAAAHRTLLTPEYFVDDGGEDLGSRLSIPFFQYVDLGLRTEDLSIAVPPEITALVKVRTVLSDAQKFVGGPSDGTVGDRIFTDMLTSYQGVGRLWYPELLESVFREQAITRQREMC